MTATLLKTPKAWPTILLERAGAADPLDLDAATKAGAFEGLRVAIRDLGPHDDDRHDRRVRLARTRRCRLPGSGQSGAWPPRPRRPGATSSRTATGRTRRPARTGRC